jgi:hypothetical protein
VKLKLLSISALCLSALVSARPGFSQQLQPLQNDPPLVSQMLQEGWEKMVDGVLQRTVEGGGKVETFTYGEDGLRWTARKLEARLELLQKEYDKYPTEELARALNNLKNQLIDVDQSLKGGVGQAEMPSSEELNACTITYDALAAADPLTYPQAPGTAASASANYSSNCGQLGNSYAYAYARATAGTVTTTKTQEDPKYNSTSVASAASVSSPGSLDCYSEAYARAWSPTLNINYEVSDYNYTCPNAPPPFSVSINGPYNVYLDDYYPCETVTWTATPSGGTPGYSYTWYISGSYYGTGQSVSKTYCRTNQSVDVSVYAYDSAGQSASNSFYTWISYEQSCSSGCGCFTGTDPGTSSSNMMPQQPIYCYPQD